MSTRKTEQASGRFYVSITSLRVGSAWQLPRFWWHTMQSLLQARSAPGIVHVAARTQDGMHYTMTVWTSRAAMRAFLRSGAHARAMGAYPALGEGRTYGYAADTIPNWPAAIALLREQGRNV